MPSHHFILWCPLLLLSTILPSIKVFSNKLTLCMKWPKYWSFSFSISTSNEYLGLISLGLTGFITLQSKGLSRVLSSTTVWKHLFLSAQSSLWSNSHICTWLLENTVFLTRWTFVGKVMALLFNTCLGWSQLSSKERSLHSFTVKHDNSSRVTFPMVTSFSYQ